MPPMRGTGLLLTVPHVWDQSVLSISDNVRSLVPCRSLCLSQLLSDGYFYIAKLVRYPFCSVTIAKSPSASSVCVAVYLGPRTAVPPCWPRSTSLSQWKGHLASTKAKYFFQLCHFFSNIMPHLSFLLFTPIALVLKIYKRSSFWCKRLNKADTSQSASQPSLGGWSQMAPPLVSPSGVSRILGHPFPELSPPSHCHALLVWDLLCSTSVLTGS